MPAFPRLPRSARTAAERGQTTLEFGLILMLVSTALIAALVVFKTSLDAQYEAILDLIGSIF